ncbi:hypothetical protein DERP_006827 [Dermatophagoides pteronyssinus]|uniref:Uncharacterized protein n=1 Tax=Dermatophagoides pteronyssinus TaxID=6956 RepID=A0ABQ8ISH1_DERPT|nr:hypothetical protein DERP_006827 [Dermatophagoides pteronyssinus]
MIFPKPMMWRQWPFRYRSPRRRSRSRPAISKRRIAVQGQDSLDGDVDGWAVECLEHDLGHLFSVGFWIQWSFSQQDWAFFGSNTQFIVEGMMPDLFHIIPVGYDTVFNWIFQVNNLKFFGNTLRDRGWQLRNETESVEHSIQIVVANMSNIAINGSSTTPVFYKNPHCRIISHQKHKYVHLDQKYRHSYQDSLCLLIISIE